MPFYKTMSDEELLKMIGQENNSNTNTNNGSNSTTTTATSIPKTTSTSTASYATSGGQYNDFDVSVSEIEQIDKELETIINRVAKTPEDLTEVSTSMGTNYPVIADYAVNKVIKAQEMADLASEIYSDLWKYRQWLSEALQRLQGMDNTWATINEDAVGGGGDVAPIPSIDPTTMGSSTLSTIGTPTIEPIPSITIDPIPTSSFVPTITVKPIVTPSITTISKVPPSTFTITPIPTMTRIYTITPAITIYPTITSTITKELDIPTITSVLDPTLSSPTLSTLSALDSDDNGGGIGGVGGNGSNGGDGTGKIKGGTSLDGKSSLLSALQRGTTKLASRLSPTGGLAGQKSLASASLAGAGLAMGAAGIAGGLLLAGKAGYYTFTPEDWEETEEEVKASLEDNFKKHGMTDEEFEAFKVSTYRIKSSELNGHIKKVEKAFSVSEEIVDEIINQYHYSIFDEDDEVDKYLLFLTMAIDGMNTTDEVNIYNILNPYFEDDDDVDFIYTGIILDEYLYDEEYEKETEGEPEEEGIEIAEYEE